MDTSSRVLAVFVCFLVFLLSSCASPPPVHKIEQYAGGAVVAVWNLENMSVAGDAALQDMQDFLTAKVTETLKEKGGYTVIEREKLLLALEELHLGSSEVVSEATRLEVGRIIGAQLMVFGGYQLAGDQFRIDLRMVEVESSAVVRSGEKTTQGSDMTGWLQAAEEAAVGLL